jgi:hypothetical protein
MIHKPDAQLRRSSPTKTQPVALLTGAGSWWDRRHRVLRLFGPKRQGNLAPQVMILEGRLRQPASGVENPATSLTRSA